MADSNDVMDRLSGHRTAWFRFSGTFELLGNVFIFSLPDVVRPDPGSAPLLFLQICRLWRDVALRTPQLWKSIHFETTRGVLHPITDGSPDFSLTQKLEQFSMWLGRAGVLPLDIHLNLYGTSDILSPFVSVISKESYRLKALELSCHQPAIDIINQGLVSGAPLLENFTMEVRWEGHFSVGEKVLDLSCAPNLQSAQVLVHYTHQPVPTLIIPNTLKRVVLRDCLLRSDDKENRTIIDGLLYLHMRLTPPSQSFQILRLTPNVQELHVSMISNDHLISSESIASQEHIRLSHLTTLIIHAIDIPRRGTRRGNLCIQNLMSILTLPTLQTLVIQPNGEIHLASLLRRSKSHLTSLTLERVRFTDDSFIELLRELVFIEKLNVQCTGGEVRDRSLSFLTVRGRETSSGMLVACPYLKQLSITDGRTLSYSHPGVEFSPQAIIAFIQSRNGKEVDSGGNPLACKLVSCSLMMKGNSRQVLDIRTHLKSKILDEDLDLNLLY